MRDWLATLHDRLAAGNGPLVRVVVAATRGSAPREAGACMLVSADAAHGTIGGGHLELVATRTARGMLAASADRARLDRFSLGASLGQCCGGIVELWFQRYEAADLAFLAQALRARDAAGGCILVTALSPGVAPRLEHCAQDEAARLVGGEQGPTLRERLDVPTTELWLFGAGHVARALVHVLAALPFRITWIDSREGMIPAVADVRAVHSPDPAEEVRDMPAGAWALVMTHSHDEDLALCEALLADGRFGWAGVIGSQPKTRRFHQKLAQRGFAGEAIARLTMPIGVAGIHSKEPAAIAVAVAAQLLQRREARAAATGASHPAPETAFRK